MGNETNTMVGYHAVPVIVDAYLKGYRGFDANLAYEAVKQSAMQKTEGIDYIQQLKYIPADKVNESVAKAAIDISHTFALSHQLSVADTLIAATALVYDLELRTLNLRDFKMIPGLRVSNSLILP